MVAILTVVLMTAAEISNLFSVFGVLICFICMAVFILRLQGGVFGTSVVHVAQPPVARVAYQKVHVPFALQLHTPGEATYSDVQLKVRSDVNYSLRSLWGVSAPQLHTLMAAPWSSFFTALLGGQEGEGEEKHGGREDGQEVDGAQKMEEVDDRQETLMAQVMDEVVREEMGETVKQVGLASSCLPPALGPAPRRTYPLVVCVVRQGRPEDGEDLSGVGALINIIHIKDSDCPVPTCVLHQYLKQYSGQLTKLQALYTQGSNNTEGRADSGPTDIRGGAKQEDEGEKGRLEGELREGIKEEEDLIPLEEACVVCQNKRTTRALLPCRHVCSCDTCFPRLENCPMCRAPIRAYFLVATEVSGWAGQDREQAQDASEEAQSPSVWQRIGTILGRLVRGDEDLWRGEP